ncbi:MAG: sn-glycerol-1-phosphate dehydrogenase [Victivallales bacterium]|nr:sn-glycerol-1-phosphate dehydrogenase [Victivallales bacterium]
MAIIPIPEGLETKLCVLGTDVLKEVPSVVRQLWPGQQPKIVADENTWAVAGVKVQEFLKSEGLNPAEPKIYPAHPVMHADYCHIPGLVEEISGKLPIAVGSGTITDLCKRSTFEAGFPGYLCVATACSVDGYTSFGAAITKEGFKQTMPCPAPLAILADSNVLSTAPADMTASGYADLCAKIVAGADWHIADILGPTPMDAKAWGMVQTNLREWLAAPEKLAKGDLDSLCRLFNGLAATGFAMQYYRESRPASGAEHLFSHIWEMDDLKFNGEAPSHGFKVAIGTLISTALMEYTFSMDRAQIAEICRNAHEVTVEERAAQIDKHLKGSIIYDSVRKVCLAKLQTGDAFRKRMNDIAENWDEMKRRVKNQIFTFEEMKRRFKVLDCPTRPEQIGLDWNEVWRGTVVAAMIRNRYTILDLLFELGLLEKALEAIKDRIFAD